MGRRFGGAALLAGGMGRRMGGRDKQSLLFEGEALGRRAARLLLGRFGELVVVTRDDSPYAGLPCRCVRDIVPGKGPLSGIHAALEASSFEWVYIMACDMPNFSPAYADYLELRVSRAIDEADRGGAAPQACLTRLGPHLEPFHALYSRALAKPAGTLVSGSAAGREPSVRDLLADRPRLLVEEAEARRFTPDWSLFRNINEPGDLSGRL